VGEGDGDPRADKEEGVTGYPAASRNRVRRARDPATAWSTPRRPRRPMDVADSARVSPSGSRRAAKRTDIWGNKKVESRIRLLEWREDDATDGLRTHPDHGGHCT
jgi:hypothetical protein